ncbi:MAG: kynureninase [Promethearchaeota archaeon]
MDADDPLREYRERFIVPSEPLSGPYIYFLGNSLGLQPKTARAFIENVMAEWGKLGVEAFSQGEKPWINYSSRLSNSLAPIVGARPREITLMNSLSVNMHLMFVSFYRPTADRYKVLIEEKTFPSDHYAIKSQMRFHGINPKEAIIEAKVRPDEKSIRTEDIEALIEEEGDSIALVWLGGINYYSGQAFELERITQAGHAKGCMVGYDLAHAVGNIPLSLHDWQVDFAVWCTYKYLNGGPAGPGGCFVHEKHKATKNLPRFEGWWGNRLETRFLMEPNFDPSPGASGWEISCISPIALAPLEASLNLFDEVTMKRLRIKSKLLTGYLEFLIDQIKSNQFTIITPRSPDQRGCQLSIRAHYKGKALFERLKEAGVFCDWREPDVIRVAPVPFDNTFSEVYKFTKILETS